jgi:hypothetical protein
MRVYPYTQQTRTNAEIAMKGGREGGRAREERARACERERERERERGREGGREREMQTSVCYLCMRP